MKHEFTLHLKATGSQNSRRHWATAAKDAKRERYAAMLGWSASKPPELMPAVRVTLTRVGPRKLDSDNLIATMKHVRDGIAARLLVDDGSDLVEWRYEQEQGPDYLVRVRVEQLFSKHAPPKSACGHSIEDPHTEECAP